MKIDEIQEGERYEVNVPYRASLQSGQHGRFEAEVTKLRVHRRVFRDGWWQQSKRPDGVEVELLVDGESFPDNITQIGTKDVLRPWAEKVAEDQARHEESRKLQRKRDVERARAKQANHIITTVLGKLDREGRPLDHRAERVKVNINDYNRHKPSPGTVYVESVDELMRLAHLVEMGLEHEKQCSATKAS